MHSVLAVCVYDGLGNKVTVTVPPLVVRCASQNFKLGWAFATGRLGAGGYSGT